MAASTEQINKIPYYIYMCMCVSLNVRYAYLKSDQRDYAGDIFHRDLLSESINIKKISIKVRGDISKAQHSYQL